MVRRLRPGRGVDAGGPGRDVASCDRQRDGVGIVFLGSAGGLLLASRYARLHLISGARATSWLASAISAVTGGVLLMLLAEPYGLVWWAAHAIDGLAVLAIGVAATVLAVQGRAVARLLAPATRVDPLVALEIGLSPEVHAFVAALERKDQITRDHVVRVAELAVRVGQQAGLPAAQLRRLGLAGSCTTSASWSPRPMCSPSRAA